ncbi:hypothetical protein Tco_1050309, partial [Tanacetum coccineum]
MMRDRRGDVYGCDSNGGGEYGRDGGPEPITPLNEGTSNQKTTKSIIEGNLSTLKELLKDPSNRDLIKPMLLDFDDIQDVSDEEIKVGTKGKAEGGNKDLSKLFKEVLKCPFTRRIVKFSSPGHRFTTNAKIYDRTGDLEDHVGRFVGMGNQGEWPMPVWCRMFQQTLDGKARAWFDKLSPGSIDNWGSLQEKFLNRFGMLKACDKDPTEILKIVWRANETLPHFKESSHKCPELAKRFSNNVPKTVDEMLKRVDDYMRSEEAFRNMELQKANSNERTYQYSGYIGMTGTNCLNQEFRRPRENRVVLKLDSLSKTPLRNLSHRAPSEKEMLADIAETFDNLKRINMKLNPKKCLFGVEEGKFLGYMVTSEGIRANTAKTKDIEEMKSPRTWGEMQSDAYFLLNNNLPSFKFI